MRRHHSGEAIVTPGAFTVRDHDGPNRQPSREEMRRIYLRRRAVLATVVGVVALILAIAVTAPREPAEEVLSAVTEPAEAEAAAAAQARDRRAINRVVTYTTHVTRGSPARRRVALTFDDGPGPDTNRILRILDRYRAGATFFNLGIQTETHPDLVVHQLEAGHAVAGHTHEHARMGALSPRDQRDQLVLQDAAFQRAGLLRPRLFRPPYGSFNPTTVKLLQRRRSLMVLWSADTGDFASPGAEVIAQRALDGAEPGAIILMHDGPGPRPQTAEALPLILEGLRSRRLRPVTIPQLLRTSPPPRNQPPPTSLDGPG